MRLLQFREFRDWLCKIPETKLSVDPKTGKVEAGRKKTEPEVVAESEGSKPSLEKHRMMQNMAQLWLQQEVNLIEKKYAGLLLYKKKLYHEIPSQCYKRLFL